MTCKMSLLLLFSVTFIFASNPVEIASGNDSQNYCNPVISPSGKNICLIAKKKHKSQVVIMDNSGANLKRSGWFSEINPISWSSDDSQIVFSARETGNNYDLWIANADLSNLQNLSNSKEAKYSNRSPVFSPNGKEIIWIHNDHLWITNRDGTGCKQLTAAIWQKVKSIENEGGDEEQCFSPDGGTIIWTHKGRLWRMNKNGTNAKPLTAGLWGKNISRDAGSIDEFPSYSPDGKLIIWTHCNRLWLMNADGTNQRALINKPAKDWERTECWQPNGKGVLFKASNGQNTQAVDDANPPFLSVALIYDNKSWSIPRTAYIDRLKMSKDGSSCFGNIKDSIVQINLSTNQIKTLVNGAWSYDVFPDNNRIVYIYKNKDSPSSVYILDI